MTATTAMWTSTAVLIVASFLPSQVVVRAVYARFECVLAIAVTITDHFLGAILLTIAFSYYAGVFDPFSTRSSLSQILNMMDQFMESPVTSSIRRNWDARETADGLHLRMDMPGLDKEDVKVSVEQNTLIIKGEGKKEFEEEEHGRRYTSRIDLPEKLYKTNEIKAEMKNGVLKVFVPKIKEEERNDVFHVNVE
ncbi:UNVERIFIED_CONTAM: Heat shock protein, mitochondrial [Sesamum radiatum]|uniref:Heat shock protein, mitochondrial n=1 Tax=Sesamum radiatum TaxID=300843 RepID=A0AAW2NC55_SESRA